MLLQLYEGGRKMLGLTILVWIFVLGIIIGGLIVFFKNKKEKEDFDDFSLESERKKEKKLFDRKNNEKDYNENDFKYEKNINLTEEKTKYETEKEKKIEKIITDNPIIKWRKSPWWIVIGIIVAIIRFCDGPDNKLKPTEAFQNQITNQNIEDSYKEWIDTAEKYEENREYEKAEEYYLKAAQYNKEIYMVIGRMYYYNVDKEKGIEKLKEAYEKGVYSAVGILGESEEEKGNINKAKEWYKKGIEKGDLYSQNSMAILYEREKKWNEAEALLLKGAQKEDTNSIYMLILLYFETNKETEMQKWKERLFNKPQRKNLSEEARNIVLYATGSENDRKYLKISLEAENMENQGKYKEEEKLYTEAIKYNKRAYNALGYIYYHHYKNKEKAMELYRKGHAEGSLEATYSLSIMERERGNKSEEEKLLKMCAEKGKLSCQADYGEMLNENNKKDEAAKWFEKAAAQKDARSMFKLMYYYFYDKNDKEKGMEWAKKIFTEKGLLNLSGEMLSLVNDIIYGK